MTLKPKNNVRVDKTAILASQLKKLRLDNAALRHENEELKKKNKRLRDELIARVEDCNKD